MTRRLADKPTPYANKASPVASMAPTGVVSLPAPMERTERPIAIGLGLGAGPGPTPVAAGAPAISALGGAEDVAAAGALSWARARAVSATRVRPISVLTLRMSFLSFRPSQRL